MSVCAVHSILNLVISLVEMDVFGLFAESDTRRFFKLQAIHNQARTLLELCGTMRFEFHSIRFFFSVALSAILQEYKQHRDRGS